MATYICKSNLHGKWEARIFLWGHSMGKLTLMANQSGTGARGRYHHGDLRSALIEATLHMMGERRVEEITVADAARAAGVSSGAPYRHFPDRDDFLAHVAATGFDKLRQAMEDAVAKHKPGSIESIVALGCAYTEFGASRPELFHLMWGATRTHQSNDVAQQSGFHCYQVFIGALSATMEAQSIAGRSPQEFGAPLWAMVHGFAGLLIGKSPMLDAGMDAIRARIDEATRAYFAGIGQHPSDLG